METTPLLSAGGSREQSRSRWRVAAAALLLCVLTLTVFGRTIGHGFVDFDDDVYVTANRSVLEGLSWRGVAWAFSSLGYAANWHPLTWLSHQADVTLFGVRPGGHHLTSILLHAANAVLLFLLLRGMSGAPGPAFLAAALFAVHPLHVESVAWVAERKDVLLGLCWMLVMLLYVRHARKPSAARWLAVVGCYALALTAKPMGVTLPFVLLVLDWWPLGRTRGRRWGRLLGEKGALFALSAVSVLLTVLAQARGGSVESLGKFPLTARLANAPVAAVAYLGQAFWPRGLSVFYPHPGGGLPWWKPLAASLLLLLATATVALLRRGHPWLAAGWCWYLVTLAPVIGLVQVGEQGRADRYTYLPLVGVILMVSWEAARLAARSATALRMAAVMGTAAVMAAAMLAVVQAGVWRDDLSLFGQATAVTRNNWLARNSLGAALARQGRFREAEEQYRLALGIRPDYLKARHNLGVALMKEGRMDEAVRELSAAARQAPSSAAIREALGEALLRSGRWAEAAGELGEALRLGPDGAGLENNLGSALFGLGRNREAMSRFMRAATLDPTDAVSRFNLGLALELAGKDERAGGAYREALRLRPGYPEARQRLRGIEERLAARGEARP